MDAAKAGAGAAASQASIPIVGPGLAIAAMVAMVAAVMALLGGIKKFAGGGLVSGPGSATSDSIPARLSAGEYVVRAAAVRQVGVAFLDSINGLSSWAQGPRFRGGELAFAAGGLVPEVKVPPAQPQMNQAVRIVNAIDPGVTHDHLQTPAGERVIVNIIGRNARAIRSALQWLNQGTIHMALLFIDGFDHYDPQALDAFGEPWLARGKAAYLSPQATRVQGRRPSSFALRLPEGSGGGYVKNLDATKTSLIVGASIRVVPYENTYTEPLLLGVRDANAQVAHLVKIGEDGRLKLYRWQYGYEQLISTRSPRPRRAAGTTSSCRSRKAPATACCRCASTASWRSR
jgi:hypothetical protein